MSTRRILVALSGTPYTPVAIEHAVELALRHGAELTGVTVTDLRRLADVGPIPVGAGAAAHELTEHRIEVTEQRVRAAIERFESACADAEIPCRVERETCDPLDELLSLWRYHDLVVFGPRGLFEYGVIHNPDDRLIDILHHGVRPILAVSERHRTVKKVLIAYNGSMESAKAMKSFMQSRLWPDPEVRIVCFDRRDAETLLADAADYCRAHGVTAETDHVEENARDHLLGYAAEWGADLLVMGSTNRARIFSRVLGDTVLKAIRHAEIPLYLNQ